MIFFKKNKTKKIKFDDVMNYIIGHIIYELYYLYPKLLPKWYRQQVDIRIRSMHILCYMNGSCKECGCKTTHLQLVKKSCEGNCYPELIPKKLWKKAVMDRSPEDNFSKILLKTSTKGKEWVYDRNLDLFIEWNSDFTKVNLEKINNSTANQNGSLS